MNTVDKWAERVYAETDFGRSIATSFAGVVGLISYLVWRDWTIAAFSSIIVFPIIRLVSAGLHDRVVRRTRIRAEKAGAESVYARLSNEEKKVVQAFVQAGGCVLTWSHVNQLPVSGPAIESLIQREVISTSTTADCTRETFVLDSVIFDVGQERSKLDQHP